jgi:hypothetical protein
METTSNCLELERATARGWPRIAGGAPASGSSRVGGLCGAAWKMPRRGDSE